MYDPGRLIAARWRLYHDDNVRIYLNNQRALDLYDYTTDYINIPWNEATLKALRPGRNVIAVQCHQNGGGQNIDVGIGVVWRGDMK